MEISTSRSRSSSYDHSSVQTDDETAEDTDIELDLHNDEIHAYNDPPKPKCDICIAKDKSKQKNIVINNLWMIWEYIVIMMDFVTDFYIIILYTTDKHTFYDGLALIIVLIVSTILQARESYLCHQPWYVWLQCGGLYETYQSWGCELPTIRWDEFRYMHCVTESLPQTIVQSIIMIKNVPNHDYFEVPLVSIMSVLMSIFSLSYILAEQATTNTGQYNRRYFAEVILSNPCGAEACFRMSVLLFFFTDTLLRVTALSLFVNVESFA
eukprot:289970_1